MNHLKTLVAMQLKDKIDLSWLKNKKTILRNTILFLLKFIIIVAVTFLILSLCVKFGIFYASESPRVMILVLTFSLALSVISCTSALMKNLYFAEDNRVLITLPVNANKIFISKLIVFYCYEIKRSFNFLIPITLGCNILLFANGCCNFLVFIWMWIPLLFIIALPVLLGAILSIPVMYIYRFLKKFSVIEFILFILLLSGVIYIVVSLINLIPENIDLMNQWPTISKFLRDFLLSIEEDLVIMSNLIRTIIGEIKPDRTYGFALATLVKFLILIAFDVVALLLVYAVSRPLFFGMMSKNFEINKKEKNVGENKRHSKYFTFVDKEFKINLRTMDISINYFMVYIIVPILILLLNALYRAMDTKELGNLLIYTFNILLMCLPLLASNSLVATYYSREGRAGYMKKAKPILAVYPLLAKLVFNVILSIPTVFATVAIFGRSANFNVGEIVILGFAILFLHVGHMLWSAMLDVMNPQNEQYATTGSAVDNPNEAKSIGLAFVISFLYAIFAYKLFSESSLYYGSPMNGCVKLLLISLLLFGSILLLFLKRIKAYYYDI